MRLVTSWVKIMSSQDYFRAKVKVKNTFYTYILWGLGRAYGGRLPEVILNYIDFCFMVTSE